MTKFFTQWPFVEPNNANNANPLVLAQRPPPQFVQSVSRGIIIIILILYNPWRQLGEGFVPAPRRWFAPDSPSRLELITLAQGVHQASGGCCCCDLWLPVYVLYKRIFSHNWNMRGARKRSNQDHGDNVFLCRTMNILNSNNKHQDTEEYTATVSSAPATNKNHNNQSPIGK